MPVQQCLQIAALRLGQGFGHGDDFLAGLADVACQLLGVAPLAVFLHQGGIAFQVARQPADASRLV